MKFMMDSQMTKSIKTDETLLDVFAYIGGL